MSTLEDPELRNAYRKLSKRAKLYTKYHTPGVILGIIKAFAPGIMITLLPLLCFEPLLYPFEPLLGFLGTLFFVFGLGFLCAFLLYFLLGRISEDLMNKAKPYRLRREEWLFLYVCEALRSLDSHFDFGLEPDRKQAVMLVHKIVEKVQKWTVGNIFLVKELVGKHINPLKQCIVNKLPPAVNEGDEENLKRSYDFLTSFAKYLIKEKPTLHDIDNLFNILTTITTIPSKKPAFKSRLLTSFRRYRKLQHVLVITSCFFCRHFSILHWASLS